MSLRLMQVTIPDDMKERAERLLEGATHLGTWDDAAPGGVACINLLIEAGASEPVMDRLEQEFSGRPEFHVVLLPVEATAPRPEEEPKTAEEPPKGGRISREELYAEATQGIEVTSSFVALVALSVVVAAVGLVRDNTAVVIGAMVIAPLLGPNVTLSLATTLGDMSLARRSVAANLVGVGLVLALSALIGAIVHPDPTVPSILSRTSVGLSDVAVAFAAGAAGAIAYTSGIAGPVIGVMVAVALVPPLVTSGLLLGSGHVGQALGALHLTAVNLICINLSGVGTFLARGVRPRTWWEESRARKAARLAIALWSVLLVLLVAALYLTHATDRL